MNYYKNTMAFTRSISFPIGLFDILIINELNIRYVTDGKIPLALSDIVKGSYLEVASLIEVNHH